MRISRTTEYGLAAVVCVAQNCDQGRVMAGKIAKEFDFPTEYLLQVMQQLVRAGVLTSKKGPNGGFTLARAAGDITMLEIIEAIDGPVIVPMNLAHQTNNKPFSIKIENIFKEVAESMRATYSKIKLADIIAE